MQAPFGIPAETVLVRPSDEACLERLLQLLDTLPELVADGLAADPSAGDNQPAASQAALLAAVDTLRPNGGKVHMFVTSLPNAGVHRLVPRHRGGAGETINTALAAKQDVLASTGTEWKAAALVAAEASVCVDFSFLTQVRLPPPCRTPVAAPCTCDTAALQYSLQCNGSMRSPHAPLCEPTPIQVSFKFSYVIPGTRSDPEAVQDYVDVAQHRDWVQTTGGSLYHYHPFTASLDYNELLNDLLWNVRREQGLEAMLRVRCSQGFDIDNCVGAFVRRETGTTYPRSPAPAILPRLTRPPSRFPVVGILRCRLPVSRSESRSAPPRHVALTVPRSHVTEIGHGDRL